MRTHKSKQKTCWRERYKNLDHVFVDDQNIIRAEDLEKRVFLIFYRERLLFVFDKGTKLLQVSLFMGNF